MNELILVIFIITILFAAVVRSSVGFGDALIAMPLLTIFFSPKLISPIIAIDAIIIATLIFIKSPYKLNWRSFFPMMIYIIAGIPFGTYFLKNSDDFIIKIILAILILSFSLFQIVYKGRLVLNSDKSTPFWGLLSGVLGGAYSTNGPPIVIYGLLRRWDQDKFRLNLQGFFLPTNILIISGHYITGLWTKDVLNLTLWAVPISILGFFIGDYIHNRINPAKFINIVYYLLIVISIVLIFNLFL
jgi:hypothetical protein